MRTLFATLAVNLALPALLSAGPPAALPADTGQQRKQYADAVKARQKALDEAAAHLNHLERYVVEWGHASTSGLFILPDLAKDPDGAFKVNGKPTFDTTVLNIRLNSQASASVSDIQSLGIQAKASAGTNELQKPVDEKFLQDQRNMSEAAQREFTQSIKTDTLEHDRALAEREQALAGALLAQEQAEKNLADFRAGRTFTKPDSITPIAPTSTIPAVGTPATLPGEATLFPQGTNADGTPNNTKFATSGLNDPKGGTTQNSSTFTGPGALPRAGDAAPGTQNSSATPPAGAVNMAGGMSLSESDLFKMASSSIVTG